MKNFVRTKGGVLRDMRAVEEWVRELLGQLMVLLEHDRDKCGAGPAPRRPFPLRALAPRRRSKRLDTL
jgi:hypothetical protein